MKELADVVGSPGVRPRFTGFLKGVLPMLLFMAFAGYFVRAAFPVPEIHRVFAGSALVLLCVILAGYLFHSERRLGSYFKGALGEERVARALHQLPAGYTVFHGVLLSGSSRDIDHVVVGPTGVFVIETKNWSGQISVVEGEVRYDGRSPDRPPLRQAQKASKFLQDAIRRGTACDVEVDAVLCFAGGQVQAGIQDVSGVLICSAVDVCSVLLDQTRLHLPDRDVTLIKEYLESAERKSA